METEPYPELGYLHVRSLLLGKRDECEDLYNSTRIDRSICTPGSTTCCLWLDNDDKPFPACEKQLGRGWCCLGNGAKGECYTDVLSVCDEEGSVQCANPPAGVGKKCCPRHTTCGLITKEGVARCRINYDDLIKAGASTSSTSVTSSTSTSSSSTELASTTTTSESTTTTGIGAGQTSPAPETGVSGPSVGLIAGAAVGGTLGFVALVVLGYLLWRRHAKAKQQAGYSLPPSHGSPGDMSAQMAYPPSGISQQQTDYYSSPGSQQPYYYAGQAKMDAGPGGYGHGAAQYPPAELSGNPRHNPAELPAQT